MVMGQCLDEYLRQRQLAYFWSATGGRSASGGGLSAICTDTRRISMAKPFRAAGPGIGGGESRSGRDCPVASADPGLTTPGETLRRSGFVGWPCCGWWQHPLALRAASWFPVFSAGSFCQSSGTNHRGRPVSAGEEGLQTAGRIWKTSSSRNRRQF